MMLKRIGILFLALAAPFMPPGPCVASAAKPVRTEDRARVTGAKALGVLKTALQDRDSDVRADLAREWGEIGSPAAIPILRKQLRDSNSYVRIAAAKSLYLLGDRGGLATLLQIIKKRPAKSEDEGVNAVEELKAIALDKVRVAAIQALSQTQFADRFKVLRWAQKDPRGAIRDAAAIALAKSGRDEEIDRFIEALNSDDENERLAAVWSLGEIATPAVVEPLKGKLHDPAYHVRAAVLQALGSAGDFDSLPDLQAGTRDENDLVRAKAVEALSRLRSREAVGSLKYVVQNSTNAYIQLLAMSGLARMGSSVDLRLAQRSLSQPDFDTRMLAVEVLEDAGGPQALEMLESALEDSQTKVRVRAAGAVIKLLKKERSR